MGRSWQLLAVVGFLGLFGCGPADDPTSEAVQGGEGVTVETGQPAEGAAAAEVPLDVIPTNE